MSQYWKEKCAETWNLTRVLKEEWSSQGIEMCSSPFFGKDGLESYLSIFNAISTYHSIVIARWEEDKS